MQGETASMLSRGSDRARVLVTGGCGFIGSALVRHLVASGIQVLNLDKLTYAGSSATVAAVAGRPNYRFTQVDICDTAGVSGVVMRFQPDAIMHLAAESHVDRSIDGPAAFIETNLVGTFRLLEVATRYRDKLTGPNRDAFRFLHVSTDEVYGALDPDDAPFTEQSRYSPNSPYSASKAGSDHLVRAWVKTHGLPAIISNCSNNYGPFQFPEKMIPTIILSALHGMALPVYGKGENIRDWLHVEDHVDALMTVLSHGRPGETYLVGGGGGEIRNIDLVHLICSIMDELLAGTPHVPHHQLISFVADRPGHDFRYAVDCAKIRDELGWTPKRTFSQGLRETVRWYLDNAHWWQQVSGKFNGQRRGMGGVVVQG